MAPSKEVVLKPQHFQWERFNSILLLGKIARIRKVDSGRCSFNSAEYHFWLPVLKTAIRATSSGAARLKEKCIKTSLSDPSVTLGDPNAFLIRCDQEFISLSKRPKSEFVLYTSITYSGPRLVDWIAEGPSRICWGPSSGRGLLRSIRKAQEAQAFQRQALSLQSDENLTPILVHVMAYDPFDAFEVATDCIDRFRGLLNLLVNSSNSVNPFARLTVPHAVNKFRRGPFHTIHKPDGSLAMETFWYEHRWLHNTPSVNFRDSRDYRRSIQKWWRRLQDSPMCEFISGSLLGYCRALDLHETDASFLGMWQVLETLTGTDRYDQLIDRLTRLFKDHEEAREVAKHLRVRRNQVVHSASNISDEADAILVQTESLASQALFFFLNYGSKFQSVSEVYSFLDLPLDQEKLSRQRQVANLFIRYQNRS